MKIQGRESTRVTTCRCYHTILTELWRYSNKCMPCSINKNRHIRILLPLVSSKISFNNYTFLQFPHKVDTSVWELASILISWCHISALKALSLLTEQSHPKQNIIISWVAEVFLLVCTGFIHSCHLL